MDRSTGGFQDAQTNGNADYRDKIELFGEEAASSLPCLMYVSCGS
jgi:hypothetical protein